MLRWMILSCLCAGLAVPAAAQQPPDAAAPGAPAGGDYSSARPVPFGPGEVLTYKVMLGIFDVGESTMRVPAIEPTRGKSAYRLDWRIKGGIPFYKVDTHFQSWFDIERLVSLRFIQDQHEGRHTRYRDYRFYPEKGLWVRADNGEKGPLATPLPLDDLSFVYFARSLDLEVGKEYRFDRYFKDSGNPVVIRVLGRGQRTVPAGTFNTIVVQPIIRTKGLFGEGGEAELHFSDDARRVLVYMKTQVPGISMTLHLTSIRNGVPVRGESASRGEIRSGPHR